MSADYVDPIWGPMGPPRQGRKPRLVHSRKDEEAPGAALPYSTFSTTSARLDVDDFVEGLLTSGTMSVVYGESNSGKTFFVSDLAMRVAAGMQWRDRAIEQGAVLYLALEGGFGISNRIAAFREEHGLDTQDIPFAIVKIGINLIDPEQDATPVIATIAAVQAQFGIPLRLVVVDTLSRAMAGGNENAPEDMTRLVGTGDEIRSVTSAHLLWIHHCGKDVARGARGHSSLRAATDTEIEITAEGNARLARVTKQRDMECGGEFAFSLKSIELGTNRRGKTVTSCVVEHGDCNAQVGPSHRKLGGHAKRALEVLSDLINSSGAQHPSTPVGVLSVPDQWWRDRFYDRSMPGAEPSNKRQAFHRATKELIDDRHIVAMDRGRVWLPRTGDVA
jgi:hypothetical protein